MKTALRSDPLTIFSSFQYLLRCFHHYFWLYVYCIVYNPCNIPERLPAFGNIWPLSEQLYNNIITTNVELLNISLESTQLASLTTSQKPAAGLIDILFRKNCMSKNLKRIIEQSPDVHVKKRHFVHALANGSMEMYDISVDFFRVTQQFVILDAFRPYTTAGKK